MNPEPLLRKNKDGRIIPVCAPLLKGNERKYLLQCLSSNWISSAGGFLTKFEDAFKKHCDTRYALTCSSGTAALHLSLAALGITRGDEVIIPTFTMIATANVVRYVGATPVLVDSDIRTWNIDVGAIEKKITRRTKAIIVVHIYGLPVDMHAIRSIAKRHKLFVIEDAAESHGASYKGRNVGGFGDAGCFSFYANKIITTGEGGMITTNRRQFAQKARMLRDHAFSKGRHFWHQYIGFNYRMTNMQGAVGLAQVERFSALVAARIRNAALYTALLNDIPGISLRESPQGVINAHWMFSLLIEKPFTLSRDQLRANLAHQGIETRAFFIPIHLQPMYRQFYKEKFPVAESLGRSGLYLPSSSALPRQDIVYVAACIRRAARV